MSKLVVNTATIVLKPGPGWSWLGWDGKVTVQTQSHPMESEGNISALGPDAIQSIMTGVTGKPFVSPGFAIPGVAVPVVALVDEGTLSDFLTVQGMGVVLTTTTGTFQIAGGPPPMNPTPVGPIPDPVVMKSGTWSIDKPAQTYVREREGEGKPYKRDPSKPSWIEIVLVDEDNKPVPDEVFRITLPDGETIAEGNLDENGFARLDGFDPGTCKITFPRLDSAAWKRG